MVPTKYGELIFSCATFEDSASVVRAVEVRDRTACILGRAIDSLEECKVEQAVLTKAMLRLGAPLGIKKLPGGRSCFVGPEVVPLVFLPHAGGLS